MAQAQHEKVPDVPRLLKVLAVHEVCYVLVGSVAASLYGVELEPNDLDIVPALDAKNLRRLTSLLLELRAQPNISGHWETQIDGEKQWKEDEPTLNAEKRASWTPNPNEIASLDHLFFTRLGDFDVVTELVGSFETLKKRAIRLELHGQEVHTGHPDDLLASLTVPRRHKDVVRVRQLRDIQRLRASK